MNDLLDRPAAVFFLVVGILVIFLNLFRNRRDNESRGFARQRLKESPTAKIGGLVGQQLTWVQPKATWGDYGWCQAIT